MATRTIYKESTADVGELTASRYLSVDRRILLAFYLVIPVCGLVILADLFFFDQLLLHQYLPRSPERWLIWAIVFDMPHIVAGLFSFFDREYIGHYKKKLIRSLGLIILLVVSITAIAPLFLPENASSILMQLLATAIIVYMVYHVLSQQFGIALSLMKFKPSIPFECVRWGAIISALLMYFMVATDLGQEFQYDSRGNVIHAVALVIILLTGVAGWVVSKAAASRDRVFMLVNVLMMGSIFVFLVSGYEIFVLLIPRFVHDLTAFYIYGVHDHNRNAKHRHNVVYRPFFALSPIFLCPFLAIGLTYLFERGFEELPAIFMIVALFHYYIEGSIWKGGSMHRQYVAFR